MELLALVHAQEVVVLEVVVVDEAGSQCAVVCVANPAVAVDDQEVQAGEHLLGELDTFLDLLFFVVVEDALTDFAAHNLHQLLHEQFLQRRSLLVEILVDRFQDGLVARLGLAVLDSAAEELLVDDHTLA